MSSSSDQLLAALTAWFQSEPSVKAVVLYGSAARAPGGAASADAWSDFDLHVITAAPARIAELDWAKALPGLGFCHRAGRPAAGGVDKIRLLFAAGEVELILMPAGKLGLARTAVSLGLHRRTAAVRDGLNVLATGLSSGYRFLKGEAAWGPFYARVARELPGLRLDSAAIQDAANLFVCDLLSCLQRLERGELAAAQRTLHRQLAETNFVLARELRLRRGEPVPSFEPARRVEQLFSADEQARVRVDARLDAAELRRAAWLAFAAMKSLMSDLEPQWRLDPGVDAILAPFRVR